MTGEYSLKGYECYDAADNKFYQGFAPYYSDKIVINKNKFKNTLEYNGCKAILSGRIVAHMSDNQSGVANISSQSTSTFPGNTCNIQSAFQAGIGIQPSTGPDYSYTIYNQDTAPEAAKEYLKRGNEILIRTDAFITNVSTDTCYFVYSNGSAPDPTPLKWIHEGQKFDSITLNTSNVTLAHFAGTPVETYLEDAANHTNANYCLVSSYQVAGVETELRTRVVPISYYDFSSYRTIRNLRVDFALPIESLSVCNRQFRKQDGNGGYVLDTDSPSPVYNPAEICPSCTGSLPAYNLRLFKENGSYLDEIPATNIDVQSLVLQVSPN